MWKEVLDTTRTLLRLAEDLRQNREEIREIRRELHDLALAVQRVSLEVAQVREAGEKDREVLVLQLENQILRARTLAVSAG
ncbi:hypothetical protein [Longimicrobium terrae]|uniref:Archaellum component FlaC n=1 Tax=Longimicrobium terrae TaxID=1639882 RepID=A0A841H673_9BACT|nr:hypothetical protein [Longimicrobium terrae]MBB4639174.1 archaellum component FlaC [Longimicrobium terrae]MBB6073422.1 archaellum component FlaC [Longimicrobium terrae]